MGNGDGEEKRGGMLQTYGMRNKFVVIPVLVPHRD